ncbi:SLBB domain-containing protein [filamentous cyanobacterium LEGE 11480]|uniref:SLBB domain-containing protein n=1 Tax=Romeriopsis navalis LEGE 11480 TaxID=2777977 RepID=A0A928Z5X9_9CYAN|nr:SLBB domain-containing protein [Romeriopsis navalis]MBE9033259.1 SLBB domain-containing protein [Romeriopsis navalis LEGE 11480]
MESLIAVEGLDGQDLDAEGLDAAAAAKKLKSAGAAKAAKAVKGKLTEAKPPLQPSVPQLPSQLQPAAGAITPSAAATSPASTIIAVPEANQPVKSPAAAASTPDYTDQPLLTKDADLGPMPLIRTPPPAGDPESWQVPDRGRPKRIRAETYKLAPGDRINVAIATVPEFSSVYQVMVDGRITLPVIGQVDVEGMTEPEAAQHIAKRYTDTQVIVKPTITVVLAEMSNLHVAVLGEVNRPGAYIAPPQNGELPRLTEIIERAGGITQQTDLKNIKIRRPMRNGRDRIVTASLWQLLMQGDLSQDVAIRDGDTIFLQTAKDIPVEVALRVGRSNVAPTEIQINVMGEVNAPGLQAVRNGTSLNQAIMQAGGFSNRAKKKKIELLRLNPNGTVTHRKIAIDLKKPIDVQLNPILQDRDVIVVDRSIGNKISDTVSKILSPFNSIFALFNTFSPFFIRQR